MATQKTNAAGQHAVNHNTGGSDPVTGLVTNGDSHDHSGGDGAPIICTSIAVHQVSHALPINTPVKLSTGTYAKAKADSAVNAEVVGIVSAVAGADDFTLLTEGRFTSTAHGLTVDSIYFLSASSAGALTATEPNTAGNISKPCVYVIDANTLYYHNWRGMVVGSAPGTHHTTHESGGTDAIKLDDLAAPDNNTDLDVSITTHGLCPKAPNDTAKFLRGDATWVAPSGGGPPTGTILMYFGTTAPTGYLLCNHASYLNADYSALSILIRGVTGGADANHFYVPEARDLFPVGAGTTYALGETGGEATHALSTAELASHSHEQQFRGQYSGVVSHVGVDFGFEAGNSGGSSITTANKISTRTEGSGTPHNNLPPYIGLTFIIKT